MKALNEADFYVYKLIKEYNRCMKSVSEDDLRCIYTGRFFWLCGILGWSVSRFVYLAGLDEKMDYTEESFPSFMSEYLKYDNHGQGKVFSISSRC